MPGSKSLLKALYSFGDGFVVCGVHCRVACVFVTQSCPTLCEPWIIACQALLSVEFSRQEYWSGLPCPSPGDLPNPGIKPESPALQADSLPSEPPGKLRRVVWPGPVFLETLSVSMFWSFFFLNRSDFPQEISSHLRESICLTARILGPKQGKKMERALVSVFTL